MKLDLVRLVLPQEPYWPSLLSLFLYVLFQSCLGWWQYSNWQVDWANICWHACVKGEVGDNKTLTDFDILWWECEGSFHQVAQRHCELYLVAHLRYADFFSCSRKYNIYFHTLLGHENQGEHVFLQKHGTANISHKWKYILSSCRFQMSPMHQSHWRKK